MVLGIIYYGLYIIRNKYIYLNFDFIELLICRAKAPYTLHTFYTLLPMLSYQPKKGKGFFIVTTQILSINAYRFVIKWK